MRRIALAAAFVFAGCGGGMMGDDVADDGDDTSDTWETLIESTWTIPPGEQYRCERLTIDEDLWIKAFSGEIPFGHHHAVLTVSENPTAPDGQTACNAGTNAPAMIYGNAPGVDPIAFPDGVAVKIPAGSQLTLNLHLFNTGTESITQTSTVDFERIDEADVQQEAEIVLMGPIDFDVPQGDSDATGGCTMSGDTTLFMFTPHMHKLGVHAHVEAKRAAGDVVLHDDDYSFDSQQFYDLDNVQMHSGDRVEITCSYHNEGAATGFGDSTNQEMCFASTYRYPKLGSNFGIICPL